MLCCLHSLHREGKKELPQESINPKVHTVARLRLPLKKAAK